MGTNTQTIGSVAAIASKAAGVKAMRNMTGTKTDGAEASLWFRSTNGFRKENGAWKIVHSHSSVPFYMDGSFKACVDLKPSCQSARGHCCG